MKQILVIVSNSNNAKMEVYQFVNEEDAKNYIKDRYVKEIRKAPVYDYENTYIDKSFRNAVVSAGIEYSVKISMCCNVRRFYKKKRGGYKKRYKK